jgi:hypothetical protein
MNGDLALSIRSAHENQIRDVHARYEQHDHDRAVHQHEDRSHRADELLLQRHDLAIAPTVGSRKLGGEGVHDGTHIGAGGVNVAPSRRATTLIQ